jgi:hypothetical protein
MLPEGNQIAESVYEAKKIICPLGIEVEKTHVCKNNCLLFRGDYADLDKSPNVAMIGTRGKWMEMIIMLMMRTSSARSEARKRRLTEGLL